MPSPPDSPRYSRQVLFPPIGIGGQARLLGRRVAIVGCGALGTALAEMMCRAGVGHLRLIDRDVVEESNLGRQSLYTAADARDTLPKAAALRGHLLAFNPEVEIVAEVADLNASTAPRLLDGVELILDGSDNFDTRYLMNDYAVSHQIPWIYGACIASRGLSAVILPGETPCLRCLFPEPPPAGSAETCDTAGIIAPAATLIAALQAAEALKLLVGARSAVRRTLVSVELWPFRLVELGGKDPRPVPECVACQQRRFPYLEGLDRARTLTYCGRDAVQVVPGGGRSEVDLDALERRLAAHFRCRRNDFVLRVELEDRGLVIFADGRALITGTGDPAEARSLYDRYVGG
jgi:adenylyltransferase/sulfurtransferase